MSIQSVKNFVKSFYYANKPFTSSAIKDLKVKIRDSVSPEITKELKPYMNGFEQLAQKYNFNMKIEPVSRSQAAIIGINENVIFLTNQMSGADMARQVYKSVSRNIK